MTMKPWIKAGLIGGGLQIIFTVPSFAAIYLPLGMGGAVSLLTCCLFFFLYPLPGILEAHWAHDTRSEGKVIFAGALAGFLATSIDGVVAFLLMFLVSATGGIDRYLQTAMPAEMEMIENSGMGFLFSTGSLLAQTAIGLIFHIFSGVVVSALAGLVYSGMRNKSK
jgi:hypothetical protein